MFFKTVKTSLSGLLQNITYVVRHHFFTKDRMIGSEEMKLINVLQISAVNILCIAWDYTIDGI